MVRALQPDILVDNRLVAGHEDPGQRAQYGDFATPEQAIPADRILDAEGNPVVWESCMTVGNAWGYAHADQNFKSPTACVRMLVECVAKGGNLLLNIGPNARGRLRVDELTALDAIGSFLDLNGDAIYGAGPAIVDGRILEKPQWGWYTRNGDTLYAHLVERPAGPIPLLNLGGKIEHARLVADGSEVSMHRNWNAIRGEQHAVLHYKPAQLPNPIVTTIALKLKPGV